jgi:site-specific DNA-methyltransferase (adenine-specific)
MPTYSTGEIAWISWLNKIDFVDITWHGMLQADMKNKEHRIHPTQKPVALYKWLIEKYAKAGDKIFDSHMGSQSSRIAAFNMGFDYWGCELDEEYFNDGNKRFIRETMQQSLFTPIPTKAEITQTTIF